MKVVLGTLKNKGDALVTFLEPRVGAKPSLSGDAIEIDDGKVRDGVKPRQVKTYIKRFLFMNGVRKNYRVFVSGKELTIQEIELGEEEEEEKKPEKKAAESPAEEARPEEPETPEAPKAEDAEEPKAEKPKKAAAKKPRAKKKKADEAA